MGHIRKEFLSASSSGLPIQVTATTAATVTTGTTLHTATATGKDEIYLWASSLNTGATLKVTVQLGTLSGAREVVRQLDGDTGMYLVVPGLPLAGAAIIRAHATSGVSVSINGYVNRIVT